MRHRLVLALLLLSSISAAQTPDAPRLLWKTERISGVTAHAFSHSGKTLAIASDSALQFWDVRGHHFTRTQQIPAGRHSEMRFAPGDTALVLLSSEIVYRYSGGLADVPMRGSDLFSVVRLSLRNGHAVRLDSDIRLCKCMLAPDGIHIATLGTNGILTLRVIGSTDTIASAVMPARREWPNTYTISFSQDGSKLVVYWYGQLLIYDARTLGNRRFIEDSFEYGTPKVIGNTVFLTRGRRGEVASLIDTRNGQLTALQPSSRSVPPRTVLEQPASAALLADGDYLIARYEVQTWGMAIEGGPGDGLDSLFVYPRDHSERPWGIGLSRVMEILDVLPGDGTTLLSGSYDGLLMTVNVRTHEIEYINRPAEQLLGFSSDGKTLFTGNLYALDAQDGHVRWAKHGLPSERFLSPDGRTIVQPFGHDGSVLLLDCDGNSQMLPNTLGEWRFVVGLLGNDTMLVRSSKDTFTIHRLPSLEVLRTAPDLRSIPRFISAGANKIVAFGSDWQGNDTANLYDFASRRILARFSAGPGTGVRSAAVSSDSKFVAIASWNDSAKVWNTFDGSLIATFSARRADQIGFSRNGSWIFYCATQSGDTAMYASERSSGQTIEFGGGDRVTSFALSHDGRRLALSRSGGIEMYETPVKW
ncbi:MAG: hypothetical protein Q8922_14320 [Bacteroidota bacterium]|nr:hypothetical protein [Bacteroidota bacterium]